MARTKGAKGMKTRAKEVGLTLEDYKRYLKLTPEERYQCFLHLKYKQTHLPEFIGSETEEEEIIIPINNS